MKAFRDKVAVITGGAGGLGRALADRFAAEGMRLVLADVDPAGLAHAEAELRAAGARAVGMVVDVSKGGEVEALAQRALDAFGAVHVVCNNAGVAPLGPAWENSSADWEWILGVNLWGVIHGVRVFAPILLEQAARDGAEGHIVNTSSVCGLISPPGMAMYNVTKQAVVALTETLHHDLATVTDKVKCSVVCPAYFPSGIGDSERARPEELKAAAAPKSARTEALEANLRKAVQSGRLTAADVAARVFDAIRDERFWVLTHPRILPAVEKRYRELLDAANPTSPV